MKSKELLDLEVSLLLLKYGRSGVLQSIARRMRLSEEVLELELEKLLRPEYAPRPKKGGYTKPFDINSVIVGHEDKAEYLRELHRRFENRTFLSELKDVKRLFDRHGRSANTWKSRKNAEASVFRFLANLDASELQAILSDVSTGPDVSSLGIISDEILGRNRIGRR